MKKVTVESKRKNNGHYSPGIIHNGLLYISGQLSLNPDTGEIPSGGIINEAKQALSNLDKVLKAANVSRDKVISCKVYLSDINNWDKVNEVYRDFFGDHKPGRVIIPTGPLHFGTLIEIEAIAIVE